MAVALQHAEPGAQRPHVLGIVFLAMLRAVAPVL